MKNCIVCLEKKSFEMFYKHKKSHDGYYSVCIICHNKRCSDRNKLQRKKSDDLISLPNETFKPTLINENYFVSNFGRVYVQEHSGSKFINGKFLKNTLMNNGYFSVQINGKKYLIHRLMAECFIEKIEKKNFVNHKDSDRKNNNLENLEWVSLRENIHHGVNKDRYSKKLNRNQVYEIRNSNLSIKDLSIKYEVSDVNITLILNKKIWKHI